MEYRIDCSQITSAAQMHSILAETLGFPEWYGENLDALYDCLTEITTQTHLTLVNWTQAQPFIRGFHRVMADAQQDNPDFTVTFE